MVLTRLQEGVTLFKDAGEKIIIQARFKTPPKEGNTNVLLAQAKRDTKKSFYLKEFSLGARQDFKVIMPMELHELLAGSVIPKKQEAGRMDTPWLPHISCDSQIKLTPASFSLPIKH